MYSVICDLCSPVNSETIYTKNICKTSSTSIQLVILEWIKKIIYATSLYARSANEVMRSRIFAEGNIKYKDAVKLALALEVAESSAEVSGSTAGAASATAVTSCVGVMTGQGLRYTNMKPKGSGENGTCGHACGAERCGGRTSQCNRPSCGWVLLEVR